MESNKRDLESLVMSQKEQLTRYEKRLKDIVAAYKGLLKEKEALETSLAALTALDKDKNCQSLSSQTSQLSSTDNDVGGGKESGHSSKSSVESVSSEDRGQLRAQIITLMNSLATLSAEKSRMEASFQSDKKQLRAELVQKNQLVADLKLTIRDNEDRAKVHLEEMKAKWIAECQDREKETNNQILMIRELQKLYADERHLKENIEMQLNNFKTQFANNDVENTCVRELRDQLKEAKQQLKQLQAATNKQQVEGCENKMENAHVLRQLQQEMQQLKEQHAVAIKNEQKRVSFAEEQSKQQAALHEVRVAHLEGRLAELSNTIGNYDRLRHQDQESIHALRKKLHDLESYNDPLSNRDTEVEQKQRKETYADHDVVALVNEIGHLKKLLMIENAHVADSIDVGKVFGYDTGHTKEEQNNPVHEYEKCKIELNKAQETLHVQKSHIATLQEKVKVLNRNIDEQELELRRQSEKFQQMLKEERNKWKCILADLENENRVKVVDLEQQLQKQRQRSLQLLEEKEQEIKKLQISFEGFHILNVPQHFAEANAELNASTSISDVESIDEETCSNTLQRIANNNSKNSFTRTKKLSLGESCHMLHYANEIARKDIEITGLRKAKYVAESSLRKAIQEKVTAKEELCDKIAALEEEVDRLERCKTREGANLEYLKNVIISFIVTRDVEGKRHMLNAISAVLQLSPVEIQSINSSFHKK